MDSDKREHYRVEDTAVVAYDVVAADYAGDSRNTPYPVSPVFRQLESLHPLEFEARDLAQARLAPDDQVRTWIANISARLDVVSRCLLLADTPDTGAPGTVVVGNGGIAFTAPELLATGTYIGLKLVFTDSGSGLTTFAEVRHARLSAQGTGFVTGARFHNLKATSRYLLERHIVRLQAVERRARLRANPGDEPSSSFFPSGYDAGQPGIRLGPDLPGTTRRRLAASPRGSG